MYKHYFFTETHSHLGLLLSLESRDLRTWSEALRVEVVLLVVIFTCVCVFGSHARNRTDRATPLHTNCISTSTSLKVVVVVDGLAIDNRGSWRGPRPSPRGRPLRHDRWSHLNCCWWGRFFAPKRQLIPDRTNRRTVQINLGKEKKWRRNVWIEELDDWEQTQLKYENNKKYN